MIPASHDPRRRILVVDDVELNRTLTAAVLRGEAYEVDCAADGAAALSAIASVSYDLVLMDLDMPGLDGCATAARIRERCADTPLAALSSRGKAHDGGSVRAAGMNRHLQRPIAPVDLVRAVQEILAMAASSGPRTFRREVQDEIVTRLGSARTRGFLTQLLGQCESVLAIAGAPGGELEILAHDLASTSGMLGYEELSLRCRHLLVARTARERAKTLPPLEAALRRAIAILRKQTFHYEAA